MIRTVLRWILLIVFVLYGAYLMVWSFQSAMLSVPESLVAKTHYETRALVFLPLSVVLISQGVIFFILLKKKKSDGEN